MQDGGPQSRVDSNVDTGVPNVDVPCGPAGAACCAGSTCELGLRCARGTCCLQANSPTHCRASSDCCAGLTCTSGACCAGRSSTCSGSADCCNGLVCSGGVCLSPDMGDIPGMSGCGGMGGTCCTGFTCRSGLVCNSTSGHCEACGEMGGRCCDGATPCVTAGLVCNPMSGQCQAAPDPTMRCGRIDGPCCAADGTSPDTTGHGNCEGGLVCTAGTCSDSTDTGGMGQPCTDHGGCDSGNICNHATNTCTTTPMDCGHDMQMCCDLGAADGGGTGSSSLSCAGTENCQFGSCSMCAGPSLSCLLAGVPLLNQQCCNGSVCRPAPLVPRCCVGAGQHCTNSLDCCGTMQCGADHMCAAGTMGSLCITSDDCGMGLTCQLFTCQPDPNANCMMQGAMCSGSAGCCQGFTCGVAHDSPVGMQMNQCCAGRGGSCQTSAECCGLMACSEGMCECRTADQTCFRDAECCEMGTTGAGVTGHLGCVAGACHIVDDCRRPGGSGGVMCGADSDCCQGTACLIGHGGGTQTQCCLTPSLPCAQDSDCCGPTTCTNGLCACRAVGETCSNTQDCCGSSFCVSGHCATS